MYAIILPFIFLIVYPSTHTGAYWSDRSLSDRRADFWFLSMWVSITQPDTKHVFAKHLF